MRKVDRYAETLELIARKDFKLRGDEDHVKLLDIIFELQNRASAALANVEYVSPDDVEVVVVRVGEQRH